MAVTLLQAPTSPNVTNTNLMYTLSSPSSSNAQFRYVTDIYESGTGNYITTIKTFPNLTGNGILDVSRELNDQLGYDEYWKTAGTISPEESVKTYDIRFGEEYAPSYSGSITQYTGSTPNYLQVFPGTVYKNEGSYNFISASVLPINILSNTPEAQTSGPSPITDALFVSNSDYATITIFEDETEINVLVYGINDTLLYTSGLGAQPGFTTLGVGPQNLVDNGMSSTILDSAYYIEVTVDPYDSYNLYLPNHPSYPCRDEYTRFAFINMYGFWDYYNVYLPLKKENQVDRSLYEKTFSNYTDSLSSYNISSRGTSQYYTEYNEMYSISTDYVNKEVADWLTEMFESPEVFIQQGSNFVPINITNTGITWNMNQYRQKLFKYDIQFKYANQPQPR